MHNTFLFEFPLPYWIPFTNNFYVELDKEIFLIKISVTEERGVQIIKSNRSDFPYTLFTIELEDLVNQIQPIGKFNQETINRLFEIGLHYVNFIIDNLRSKHDLLYLHNIVTTDLPPLINSKINGNKIPYITCAHRLIGENRKSISLEDFKNIWNNSSVEPRYIFYFDTARSNFILGRNSESIINIQIAFESFINYIIEFIVLKENIPEDKKESIFNSAFRHQIEHFIAKKIGKNLSFNKNIAIKIWKEYIYNPRNKIVHEGENADTLMARKALKVFIIVHNYLINLSNKKLTGINLKKVDIGAVSLANQKQEFDSLLNDKILLFPESIDFKTKFRLLRMRLSSRINSYYLKFRIKIRK